MNPIDEAISNCLSNRKIVILEDISDDNYHYLANKSSGCKSRNNLKFFWGGINPNERWLIMVKFNKVTPVEK